VSRRADPRLVGGFVVGAVALLVVAVLVFGSGKLFRPKYSHVLFFEGSVQGLEVGAPVSFRGVQVGEVTDVAAVAPGGEGEDTIFIEVQVDIFDDVVRTDLPLGTKEQYYASLDALVKQGLRARLETQSMITGQRYVGLDFYPDHPVSRKGWNPAYYELPTVPTTTQELRRTLDRVLAGLEEIPFQELVEELRQVLAGLHRLVDSAELVAALEGVNEAMEAFQATLGTLEGSVTSMSSDLDDSASAIQSTLVEARAALQTLESILSEGQVLHFETLENLNDTLGSIRALAAYLEQHPEALLVGKGERE